jgi:ribonucleotide reductase alpha subunit
LGNNETFEAFTTNIYSRRVLSGEFICVNRHLIEELLELGLWNQQIKNEVLANNGSVQNIKEIPGLVKSRFRTVWELP